MPNHIMTVVSWIIANKGALAGDATVVIASASALVKGLELICKLVSGLVPEIGKVDGVLTRAVAFLTKVQNSKALNKLALTPKPKS